MKVPWKDLAAGAAGGVAGSLMMAAMMGVGQKIGMVDRPLPEKVEEKIEERVGIAGQTSERQQKALSWGQHLLIGGALGAAYGLFSGRAKPNPLVAGPLYGLGTYVRNLVIFGPSQDLTPGPWEEKPGTVARRMGMHLLFGTVTALVTRQVRQSL